MKRSRFTEEQIIGILKEAEVGDQPAIAVCRKHGIAGPVGSWAFIARWRAIGRRERNDEVVRERLPSVRLGGP